MNSRLARGRSPAITGAAAARSKLSRAKSFMLLLRVIPAAIEFGRPDGEVVGRVEIVVIPAQFLPALLAGQPRPRGAFLAHRAREAPVVFLRVLDLRFCRHIANRHGNNSS